MVTVPGVLLVTHISIRHCTPALMVAFVNVMVSDPVTAVSTAEVPQFGDTNGLVELLIVTPVGSVSVKEKFVSAVS